MTVNVKSFATKTPDQIRDDFLRTIKNGLIARGIPAPAINPGSDFYIEGTALSNEISVLYANQIVQGDNQMLDTATGANLDRLLAMIGLARRTAGTSAGFVSGTSSYTAGSFVAAGTQLTDASGLRYQVTTGGTYATNAAIPVSSIDTGATTNHASGDVLKWVTAPTGMSQSVSVNAGGLVGAVNAEDDETVRARAINRMQNPPAAGNAAQIAQFCTAASPNVQAAFPYPAVNGPATVHVAVTAYPTNVAASTAKNRDVDTITLNSVVTPYVQGQLGEYVESVITTVVNVPTDVAIFLTLPSSPLASPPGPGGGWLDGNPWPTTNAGAPVTITSSNGTTIITVNAQTPPTANVSRIACLSPYDWTLYTATVLSFTGSAGAYTLTLDRPISAPGGLSGFTQMIWPQSVNQANYVAAILAAFAAMGPGEKSANTSVLSRGYRHPPPQLAWPYALSATQLRYITSGTPTIPASPEVIDVSYAYRSTTTPAVPGSVSSAPSILVPRNLGFYSA